MSEFTDTFSDHPDKTTSTKDKILVQPGTRPLKLPPYRVSNETVMKKKRGDMLRMRIIEPSSSPWPAPVDVIPKPDKTFRFCVDYRRLKDVAVTDAFPIPRIDDLIDSVGQAKFLTKNPPFKLILAGASG